jgi:hypothetical protein
MGIRKSRRHRNLSSVRHVTGKTSCRAIRARWFRAAGRPSAWDRRHRRRRSGADAGADHHIRGNSVRGERMHHAHLNGAKAAAAGEHEGGFRRADLVDTDKLVRSRNRRVGKGRAAFGCGYSSRGKRAGLSTWLLRYGSTSFGMRAKAATHTPSWNVRCVQAADQIARLRLNWVPALEHRAGMRRSSGTTESSALDERLLDHEMAGLAVAAFEQSRALEHLAQFFQHAGLPHIMMRSVSISSGGWPMSLNNCSR